MTMLKGYTEEAHEVISDVVSVASSSTKSSLLAFLFFGVVFSDPSTLSVALLSGSAS